MLVVDLQGEVLLAHEAEMLQSSQVSGLILFGRNCRSPEQVRDLVDSVRQLRPELIVMVDQEGGRVRRLREGFEVIPPMSALGRYFDHLPEQALSAAERVAQLLAEQVQRVGIDLPLAPVLDVGGCSRVIGDRAFHADPERVGLLASAFVRGLARGGVAATAKHFPGHGGIAEDTHLEIAVDQRGFEQLESADLKPFCRLIEQGLPAVMPAHVVFPAVDHLPVGFSSRWLQRVLRQQLGFSGVIISDDLGMAAAKVAGDLAARCEKAAEAGCDLLLLCNTPKETAKLVSSARLSLAPLSAERLAPLRARSATCVAVDASALLEELSPFSSEVTRV